METETLTFKEQLTQKFIPAIKRMIEKEKQHLQFLKRTTYSIKFLWIFNINFKLEPNKEFIKTSERMLEHLQFRLNEYTEYAEKL